MTIKLFQGILLDQQTPPSKKQKAIFERKSEEVQNKLNDINSTIEAINTPNGLVSLTIPISPQKTFGDLSTRQIDVLINARGHPE